MAEAGWGEGLNPSLFPAPPSPSVRPWKRPTYERDALVVGPYRYWLTRRWSPGPTMALLGINPSVADGSQDDNTIYRGCDFADLSGHGALLMLNPFAWIDTDVRALRTVADPVGPENDQHIRALTASARTVVVGWGPPSKVPAKLRPRFDAVVRMLLGAGVTLHALSLTTDGYPEHPLMLPRSCRPFPWSPR